MKKAVALILFLALSVCLMFPVGSVPAQGIQRTPPSVSAESAILINAEDGSVYFSKNADERMGMASTTKLMTALVAIENADPNRVITIPPEAVGVEGSSIYLVEGERLTLRELLYALLLSSANDAATAIAVEIGGSVEGFADRMNSRAAQMGLVNTRFTNPHGLYDDGHYTTARELARIAAEALAVPLLREIVSTYKATIPHDGTPDLRLLVNHNKLLRTYKGAIGMKTGFTKKTGRTLVSAAERDGLTLIAVTLNAPNDWQDHAAMLDYGFASYERIVFAAAGAFLFHLPVTGGEKEAVTLTNAEPLVLTLPTGHGEPSYRIESTSRFWFAPIRAGDAFGRVTLTCEGQTVSSVLLASHDVRAKEKPQRPWIKRFFQ